MDSFEFIALPNASDNNATNVCLITVVLMSRKLNYN